MPDIVLATINARYAHAAFGLRYLKANLGALEPRSAILEFDLSQRATDIVEHLLAPAPRIVGLGVYIWNVDLTLEVASILKKVRPDVLLVLGGPEVSYETEGQPLTALADYVVTGEADLKFAELCGALLRGEPPGAKIIPSELPDLARLKLPYDLYDEKDVAHRIIYVEASRGCPFTCEFCLSSLDIPVRQFELDSLLTALNRLLERGVQHFKFVDRTFNLNLNTSRRILEFFWDRHRPGLFLHFEMIPDRLPEELRGWIQKFPPGALQFEVGVQSLNPEVSERIKRKQNVRKLEENIRFLREHTGVHIHADLIVGLPGETVESFGSGFDQLVRLGPQEIQVGILKRLRGTPIVRHDRTHGMIYSEAPPYEILRTDAIGFTEMQMMRRFARHWDLIANSGNFIETTPMLWKISGRPFASFLELSQFIHKTLGRQHAIALGDLAELVFNHLAAAGQCDRKEVAEALWRDYQRGGRSDRPPFLRPYILETALSPSQPRGGARLKRQARRLHVPAA